MTQFGGWTRQLHRPVGPAGRRLAVVSDVGARPMTGEIVPIEEIDGRFVGAWRDLTTRAAEPNPFFEPGYVVPAAETLADHGTIALLIARRGPDIHFLAPVHRVRRGAPPNVLVNWLHGFGFLGTPLVDADHATASAACRAAIGIARKAAWRVALDRVRTSGPVYAAMSTATSDFGDRDGVHEYERAALVRRPDFDYFASTMRGRHRREMHRRHRGLEARVGGEAVTVDVTGDGGSLEQFISLEASGWKGRDGHAIGTYPGAADFFARVCRTFDEQGRLRLLALTTPIGFAAAIVNLSAGDTLFMVKMAFEEKLGEFSPGFQLVHDVALDFHANTALRSIDSCADSRNPFINRLFPDRVELGDLTLGSSRHASRAVIRGATAFRRVQRAPQAMARRVSRVPAHPGVA